MAKSLVDKFFEKVFMLVMRGKEKEVNDLISQAKFDDKTRAELNTNIKNLQKGLDNIENILGKKR